MYVTINTSPEELIPLLLLIMSSTIGGKHHRTAPRLASPTSLEPLRPTESAGAAPVLKHPFDRTSLNLEQKVWLLRHSYPLCPRRHA